MTIPPPLPGSPHFVVGTGGLHHRLISATPPAFVIDAIPKLRKLGTFVTVLVCTKRLAPKARPSSAAWGNAPGIHASQIRSAESAIHSGDRATRDASKRFSF